MEGRQETPLGRRFLSRTSNSWRGEEIYSFLQINRTGCGGGHRKEETLLTHAPKLFPPALLFGRVSAAQLVCPSTSCCLVSPSLPCLGQAGTRNQLHPHKPPTGSGRGQLKDLETSIILVVKKGQSAECPHLPLFLLFYFFLFSAEQNFHCRNSPPVLSAAGCGSLIPQLKLEKQQETGYVQYPLGDPVNICAV